MEGLVICLLTALVFCLLAMVWLFDRAEKILRGND
jgi:hypothetical protein